MFSQQALPRESCGGRTTSADKNAAIRGGRSGKITSRTVDGGRGSGCRGGEGGKRSPRCAKGGCSPPASPPQRRYPRTTATDKHAASRSGRCAKITSQTADGDNGSGRGGESCGGRTTAPTKSAASAVGCDTKNDGPNSGQRPREWLQGEESAHRVARRADAARPQPSATTSCGGHANDAEKKLR